MEEGRPVIQSKYTLTLDATKSAETKALALDGKKLNAGWANGETVAVYLGSSHLGDLTVSVTDDESKATLSGTFTTELSLSQGDELTLVFPQAEWNYSGQTGQLVKETESIEKKYDFAVATVEVSAVNGSSVSTSGPASFQTQQSIYRFSFAEKETLEVASFQISASSNQLVQRKSLDGSTVFGALNVTPEASTKDWLYVSLCNENKDADETYAFNVSDAYGAVYVGSKKVGQKYMGAGRFLSAKDVAVAKVEAPKADGKVDNKADIL